MININMEFRSCRYTVLFAGLFILIPYGSCDETEPTCTSRFDFESKLLKTTLKLDLDMSNLKERYKQDVEALQDSTKAAIDQLGSLSEKLKNEQASKLDSLKTLGSELEQKFVENMYSLESRNKALNDTLVEVEKGLETKFEELREIQKQTVKSPVVFLSKGLTNLSPSKDEVLIFSETVTNRRNAYDPSAGYFIAPVNGTYSFSLQLCLQHSKYVHVLILADGRIVNNAHLYDSSGGYPCETLNTYVYLHQNARVCVKRGDGGNNGKQFFHQEGYRWNMFMGALVH